jgi:hypothetical protein
VEAEQQRPGDRFQHGGGEATEQCDRDHRNYESEHICGRIQLAVHDSEQDREQWCQHYSQGISSQPTRADGHAPAFMPPENRHGRGFPGGQDRDHATIDGV